MERRDDILTECRSAYYYSWLIDFLLFLGQREAHPDLPEFLPVLDAGPGRQLPPGPPRPQGGLRRDLQPAVGQHSLCPQERQ